MARKKARTSKPPPPEGAPAEPPAVTGAGGATPGNAKPGKPAKAWRAGLDFIGMIGAAVCIALLIKGYAFDVYLIPSGSMETALHGRPDGGDRIFCSKLNYHFRPPKRWEVAVFEFPYESARRVDPYNSEQYRDQNFVKRIVGLPGETLAIGRGDIWTRSDPRAEYRRMVKPDSVQRGMWLNVYEEDFSDLGRRELDRFWNIIGGGVGLEKGGPLVLRPGSDAVRLDYRPKVPAGLESLAMVELPGIPDRYTLRQPIQFKCRNVLADGKACGHVYVKTFQTHNIEARCPACGSLQDETSAFFYQRRSGLPTTGRYAVSAEAAPQGEDSTRRDDYHIVPDLRVVMDVTLAGEKTSLAVTLREDSRFAQAVFSGDGRVEVLVNGESSRAERRALADIRPGRTHRVEFYVVDGVARVFVDSTETPVLDVPVWDDRRPFPRNFPKSSGVGLTAAGGEVSVRRLLIDRDVFYYSGWEQERGEKFASMNSQGEVAIGEGSFFPMGDHCPSSFDARSWGPVQMSLLRGPALLVWWPPDRVGRIASP